MFCYRKVILITKEINTYLRYRPWLYSYQCTDYSVTTFLLRLHSYLTAAINYKTTSYKKTLIYNICAVSLLCHGTSPTVKCRTNFYT